MGHFKGDSQKKYCNIIKCHVNNVRVVKSRLFCVGYVIHRGKEKCVRSVNWNMFGEESIWDA
jgi:hypothetical protein